MLVTFLRLDGKLQVKIVQVVWYEVEVIYNVRRC